MNEFLICSNTQLRLSTLHLFNQCLKNGVYPWNVALITPLHKKGDRYNPDNYRAIAVSSALGKLFSNILLERLTYFRQSCCPDPPNQLGFCKEAQTTDHIFTLTTCINKYLSLKQRVHSCFIDFRKAFDSVSRDALLFKLSKLGINGRYLECIRHMYSNSRAKIKLLDKLSRAIDVTVGTEQGHPMSPELFKIFLLDLSNELNGLPNISVPRLNQIDISHLLWADDLVLLALDSHTLQRLIDRVYQFCSAWGLEVNIGKTAILIFNKSGKILRESHQFTYGDLAIPSDNRYCYLGITLTLSGSLTVTMNELRKKGLRAYFSLKNLVDISKLSVNALLKLFDALILPVVSYGCPIWLPNTWFIRQAVSDKLENQPQESFRKIASDPIENLHLKFLKWILGVHKKTTNVFCWGDTGRPPLVQKISKQAVDYFWRLEGMSSIRTDDLARHAFEEQKMLKLPWYESMSTLVCPTSASHQSRQQSQKGYAVREELGKRFQTQWEKVTADSSKMKTYQLFSGGFRREVYLDLLTGVDRKHLARLRSSAHRLNVESGRYENRAIPRNKQVYENKAWRQCCKICCQDNLELLLQLPSIEPAFIEDERHVLTVCPAYKHLRDELGEYAQETLQAWDNRLSTLFEEPYVKEIGSFIRKIFELRFPKRKDSKAANTTKGA